VLKTVIFMLFKG